MLNTLDFRNTNLTNYTSQDFINSSGANLTLDLTKVNYKIIVDSNCTLTFTNPMSGMVYVLILKQDSIGNRLVTFPANVVWATPITLTTTPNHYDFITLYYDNEADIYIGSYTLDYA